MFSLYYRKTEGKTEKPGRTDEDGDHPQEKERYRYKIQYAGRDGTVLGEIEGLGKAKSEITIPEREYSGYTVEDGQRTSLKLDLDETTVTIYVKATEGNQVCDVEIRPMYVVEQAY